MARLTLAEVSDIPNVPGVYENAVSPTGRRATLPLTGAAWLRWLAVRGRVSGAVSCCSSPFAADRTLRDVVQRWVHALVSRQYHLMSSHQSPPSGIILLGCNRIPHIQQETTPARRAPLPFPGGRRVSSAMTSPPVGQPRPASPPAGQAPGPVRHVDGSEPLKAG